MDPSRGFGPNLARCLRCGAPVESWEGSHFCPKCLFADLAAGDPAGEEDKAAPAATAIDSGQLLEPPIHRFGDYELLTEIARGGMGIVYKARQRSLGRLVAVKLLHFGPLAGEAFVKRLRMEAATAGCLRHPNIVAIHEFGIHQDQHYLVMDYVDGPSLAHLAAREPFSIRRSADLIRSIAGALHYAHERGILHRDLKPSNILLEGDQPRITDFGLAKRIERELRSIQAPRSTGDRSDPGAPELAESSSILNALPSLTLTGQVLGSPNYMPPEQASARGDKIGRASDVYSIGAILYHLLTGRPPFVADSFAATLHQVIESEPCSPRLFNPKVPVDLETICLKCLQKEPTRRYPTAQDLAEDLERFVHDHPIRARPISRWERVWRWCRRSPGLSSACAVLLLLLLLIAIGSPIAAFRIERERQRAAKGEAEALDFLYAAQMNLVQQAWEQNNIGVFRQLLDETRAHSNDEFEWRYWENLRNQERWTQTIRGPKVNPWILGVSFSPDGGSVLGWAANGNIRLWDVSSGRELLALQGRDAAFSPNGRQLAFRNGGTATIWDLQHGGPVVTRAGFGARALVSVFAPDGREVATWSDDQAVSIWNTEDGRERLRIETGVGSILALVYDANGRELCAAGSDGTVRSWDAQTGAARQTRRRLDGDNATLRTAAFSPDGRLLAVAGEEKTLRLWDLSERRVRVALEGHNDRVTSAVFSPDGQRILSTSMDQTARLWDLATGRELQMLKGHEHWVLAAAFSPQGDHIVTGARNGQVKLWSLDRGGESIVFHGAGNLEKSAFAAFSPDGRRIATAGPGSRVKLWDVDRGKPHLDFAGHSTNVHAAVFSPDGEQVLSASWDGTALLWRSGTGEILHTFQFEESLDIGRAIAFSHDGRRVAIGSAANDFHPRYLRVWNAQDGTLVATSPRMTWGGFCTVAFSPDDRMIATASSDWVARLWDPTTGQELRVFSGHTDWVRSAAFSPDGQRLVTASADRKVKIWDVASGRELLTIAGHKDQVYWAEFSPSGTRILTASHDNTAKLWNALNGRLLLALTGHSSMVVSANFSRDGQRIATASFDGTVRLWESGSAAATVPQVP